MRQTAIPYILMRGGTSRGPYFNRADLPQNLDQLSNVLVSLIGSGHPLNIDGIGGGNSVTTKVAMLSRSEVSWADIDYFFAQVSVEDRKVDFKPTCGNILCGVASAAIEMGLFEPTRGETSMTIRAVNTGAAVVANVQTPNGQISYSGNVTIDGVPGCASPVKLNFRKVAGSSTGAFLPSGNLTDEIDGIEVTCMDVAMPMVIARATDFNLTGYENSEELNENKQFFNCMESVRIKAGALMGIEDVQNSVTPKFGILSPARGGGTISARYFMPWSTHPSMAVTGGQCLASCALTEGTVADGLLKRPKEIPATVKLEHPSGTMPVIVDYKLKNSGFEHISSGIIRTCRKLAEGRVFVPNEIWDGKIEG